MKGIYWTQIVTALVAVYGAIMSTITFLSNRKDKQCKLTIKISDENKRPIRGQVFMIVVTVFNSGNRDITIDSPKILFPNGKSIGFPDYDSDENFPHRLVEGTKCTIWVGKERIANYLEEKGFKGIVKFFVEIEDGKGRKYRSKDFWKINTAEWAT